MPVLYVTRKKEEIDGKSSYAGAQMWFSELRLLIKFLWIYTCEIKNHIWSAVVSRLGRHDPLKEAPKFPLCIFSCVLFFCCYLAMILFCIFFVLSLQLVYLPALGNFAFTRCLQCLL